MFEYKLDSNNKTNIYGDRHDVVRFAKLDGELVATITTIGTLSSGSRFKYRLVLTRETCYRYYTTMKEAKAYLEDDYEPQKQSGVTPATPQVNHKREINHD